MGAIIVYKGNIIARAHNLRENNNNALAHAEILAINEACNKLNSWRLDECELYVTLEPCPMCAGAIINSRIRAVYLGRMDSKAVHAVQLWTCSEKAVLTILLFFTAVLWKKPAKKC